MGLAGRLNKKGEKSRIKKNKRNKRQENKGERAGNAWGQPDSCQLGNAD